MKKLTCPNCNIPLNPKGSCPRCAWPRFTARLSSVLLMIVALLGLYGGLGYFLTGRVAPQLQPKNLLRANAFPYEVRTPPPSAELLSIALPRLDTLEREQLRTMFESRDFAALTASLQALQEEFEQNPDTEARVCSAFKLFAASNGAYDGLLQDWQQAQPQHFAPLLARGLYLEQRGWDSRGHRYASETSSNQFEQMGRDFTLAREQLQHALQLRPRLLPAYLSLIEMAGAESAETEEDLIVQGKELFPGSYRFYGTVLHFQKPRWGGNYGVMEAYADQAMAEGEGNPELYRLYGLIYEDQADRFRENKEMEKALEYYQKALVYGETESCYNDLGLIYLRKSDYAQACNFFDRAITLNDNLPDTFRHRASCYYGLGRLDLAMADIRRAKQLAPDDADGDVKKWSLWVLRQRRNHDVAAYRQELLVLAGNPDLANEQ